MTFPPGLDDEDADRIYLYRCRECGAIYDDGSRILKHVAKHSSWINWPWNWFDRMTPFTEKYDRFEVSEWRYLPGYFEADDERVSEALEEVSEV